MRLFICGIIAVSVSALVYLYNDTAQFDKIRLSGLNTKKESGNPLRKNKVVVTNFQMGVGHNNTLGLALASPYKNSKQQSQLRKYETRIKNDFLMEVDEATLKEWVKKRNYRDIKSKFRKIVNKYLDEPVPEIYLSSFFYE